MDENQNQFTGFGYEEGAFSALPEEAAREQAAAPVPPPEQPSLLQQPQALPAQAPPYPYPYPYPYPPQWIGQQPGLLPGQPAPAPPAPKVKRKRTGAALFAVFAALALLVGVVVGIAAARNYTERRDNPAGQEQTNRVSGDDSRMELADTPAGDKSTPAVEGALTPVEIHNKLKDTNVAVQIYSGRGTSAVGEGSGILLHEDSRGQYTYVVTCAHVINGNDRVSVELADGRSFDAEIVGYDNRTDVGLLRIKKTGLPGAQFGDSEKLQVGEPVYAIGNPGGIVFKGSFTSGIVSAIERPITSRYKMMTIQHTAPINPGNSGGALVNALGQVIGINSQKIMDAEYEGMGFAIPSKTVRQVVNDLISRGFVPGRPKLGIKYTAASQTQAGYWIVRSNNLPSGSLIIVTIDADSVLNGTEVRAGDIITHVDGKPLNKPDVLLDAVENGKVGTSLKLTIVRVDSRDYSISQFDVTAKLVEDKGNTVPSEEETRPWYYDGPGSPYDW